MSKVEDLFNLIRDLSLFEASELVKKLLCFKVIYIGLFFYFNT